MRCFLNDGSIIIVFFILSYNFSFSQFCASDGCDEPSVVTPEYTCNAVNFSKISTPPDKCGNNDTSVRYCDMVFLLDLDQRMTSQENYSQVIQFISGATTTCMNRCVGYKIFVWPLFNDVNNTVETICCEESLCYQAFGFMNYKKYVGMYDSLEPVQNDTPQFNFSYTLIYALKRIGTPANACLYNNYVLITNRVFNISDPTVIQELNEIQDVGCITFTILVVGNDKIDTQIMFQAYGSITLDTFVVPSFNCLDNLKDCIKPCGVRKSQDCYHQELTDCPFPTTSTTLSTVVPSTTPKPTPDPKFYDFWQIIYLFDITNKTSPQDLDRIVKYVTDPMKKCEGHDIVVRFLARNNSDSDWISDLAKTSDYLSQLKYDEVIINDDGRFSNGSQNVTLELVHRALNTPIDYDVESKVRIPRITLLTDYASTIFISAYNSTLQRLVIYDFNIITFTTEAYDGYREGLKGQIKSYEIINGVGYMDNKFMKLCENSSNVTTIMFIIIGACSGFMLILVLLTVLYRQKYMWMRKLKRFKTSHQPKFEFDDVIDSFEFSWEKLIVKSEKLGHGAYGHVYKGKVCGVPPAIENLMSTEANSFVDCDCAVKMLPIYAKEASKQEFLHEIELMKNLGYNEHIVNILGCITTSPKLCLILEYCTHRDLLRYVKQKKVDLDNTKNADNAVECNKEFLNFSWQIAQGMCFLVDKRIVHRDLAARNILISSVGGIKSAKIGDFGLSLSLEPMENAEVSGSDRLPIKWLAIESLEKSEFTQKSDVWSYGIVLFEMYSFGESPFDGIEPNELLPHLKTGARPSKPRLANDKLSEVMQMCWREIPLERPDFDELSLTFTTMLEQTTEGYGYLELVKTDDYKVVPNEITVTYEDGTEVSNGAVVERNRSLSGRPSQQEKCKLNREYSLTAHVINDETQSTQTSAPKSPGGKEHKEKKRKSYLNISKAHRLIPSLNSINLFHKDNEFKKTIKKRLTRRGSVPY